MNFAFKLITKKYEIEIISKTRSDSNTPIYPTRDISIWKGKGEAKHKTKLTYHEIIENCTQLHKHSHEFNLFLFSISFLIYQLF